MRISEAGGLSEVLMPTQKALPFSELLSHGKKTQTFSDVGLLLEASDVREGETYSEVRNLSDLLSVFWVSETTDNEVVFW